MAVTDIRTKDHYNSNWDGLSPRWFKSGEITKTDDDNTAMLFTFPNTPSSGARYFQHNMALSIPTLFLGGTTVLVIGEGTIGNDDDTMVGATLANQTADHFYKTGVALPGATGIKTPLTDSVYYVGLAANTAAVMIWDTDATDIPCIYASLTSDGAITAGSAYLYILLSRIHI